MMDNDQFEQMLNGMLSKGYEKLDDNTVGHEMSKFAENFRANDELLRALEEKTVRIAEENRIREEREKEDILPDTQVLDVVRFLIRDLEEEGRIDCPCHNGDYEVAFADDGVLVYCRNCEGRHFFPVRSIEAAEDLLSCDSLTLTGEE